MDKLILTGGTGYIGSQFIKKFHEKFEIYPVARTSSNLASISPYIPDDQIIRSDVIEKITQISANYFLHLAAVNDDETSLNGIANMVESNVKFPALCLEAFQRGGGRHIVNCGSYWQYKDNKPNNPNTFYASTKQAFEDIINFYSSQKSMKAITVALFDTYGPDDPRKKILKLIKDSSVSGQELQLTSGEQLINYTHVADVVSGLGKALDLVSSGADIKHSRYFLKSPKSLKLKELVSLYLKVNNLSANLKWGERPSSSRDFFCEIDILEVLPGWEPQVDLEEGLKNL